MRSIMASILGLFLLASTAFCGEQCAAGKGGDYALVLTDAANALEASNPELAGKVRSIASDCKKLGLGDKSKEAPKSEHPAAASSEHPSGGHSEHPR